MGFRRFLGCQTRLSPLWWISTSNPEKRFQRFPKKNTQLVGDAKPIWGDATDINKCESEVTFLQASKSMPFSLSSCGGIYIYAHPWSFTSPWKKVNCALAKWRENCGNFPGTYRDLTPPQCHLSPRKLMKTLPLSVLFRYNDGKEPPFFGLPILRGWEKMTDHQAALAQKLSISEVRWIVDLDDS